MANLTMTNWRIVDKLPYINLGSAGENNASIVTITVDALIDNANYYLDIGDEGGINLPNTQELKPSTNVGTNGETIYTLSMQPMVSWLGREGIKLLQVRCVYTEDNQQVVKESNVFHAKVDRNSGFVYKYDIAVFEEYLKKIKDGGGSGEYVTEDELIEALRPYATQTEVGDAITTALVPYPTTSEVDTAINTALTPYATTSEVNTAINTALTPYSTTSQMNTAIDNAVADKQDKYNDIRDNVPLYYIALNNAISSDFAKPNSYLVYDQLNNVFLLTVEKRTNTSETQRIVLKIIALSDRTKNINIKFYYQSITSLENPQPLYLYVNGYVRVVQLSGEFANISFGDYQSNLPTSTYTWEQYNPVTFANQVIEMPTASILTLGNIYQYVGDTDANYTNGLFYECVSDGEATPTYSWIVKNVIDLPIAKGKGNNSLVENDIINNIAQGTYAHAEGYDCKATSNQSHAEGNSTTASGLCAHSEGSSTMANGNYSHAEGQYSTASGIVSHAEGTSNANGYYAHSQNRGTNAQGYCQTVIGKYNVSQGTPSSMDVTDYALIIGNGVNNDRKSNALAVQWDGTVVMQDNSTIKSAKTVYEVMGKMGAKNLLVYPYLVSSGGYNGLTFNVNSDGSITCNGEATAYSHINITKSNTSSLHYKLPKGKYILSCQVKDISGWTTGSLGISIYYNGNLYVENKIVTTKPYNELEFEITAEMSEEELEVRVIGLTGAITDNVIIYPMIRLVDDQDSTWQPYAKTNYQLTQDVDTINTNLDDVWKAQGQLGAKNLLVYPYADGTRTINGVTYTLHDDGSITANGTATAYSGFELFNASKKLMLPQGDYILSSNNEIFVAGAYIAIWYKANASTTGVVIAQCDMNHRYSNFTITQEIYDGIQNEGYLLIRFVHSTDNIANNITLYPMIRYADDTDPTWQPYVMTNKELTDNKLSKVSTLPTPNSLQLGSYYLLTNESQNWENEISGLYCCVNDNSNNPAMKRIGSRKKIVIATTNIWDFYNNMKQAYTEGNVDVYIKRGTITYTNDFVEYLITRSIRGIPIGNNCTYTFASGNYLICEYTGSNTDVKNLFSPLDSQNTSGSFEINNLHLVTKNVIYGLHDESDGGWAFSTHTYNNCYIELDNTALDTSSNSLSKAIGGGLARYGEIIIKDCVFKAINPSNTRPVQYDVSYHTANNSDTTDVHIVISGCYFNGTFSTSNVGDSNIVFPRLLFTNNSLLGQPNLESTWDCKAWNNEIRT